MPHFIPVQYGKWAYPAGITPRIREVAAHFGKDSVPHDAPFSLHTEYSAGPRTLSALTRQFPTLCESCERGVPLLWTSEAWAAEFALFVRHVCGGVPPTVLEIHPPFGHTCTFPQFFQRFAVFESQFRQWAPHTPILIENRCGNRLGKSFLFSKYQDFLALSEHLAQTRSDLRIAFDVPQIFTAHRLKDHREKIVPLLEHLHPVRHFISGIHLWGAKDGAHAHYGDLNSHFLGNTDQKDAFLSALYALLNDNTSRYFVPEVNSNQADFDSILSDLLRARFLFES